jgi:hypothetical protein
VLERQSVFAEVIKIDVIGIRRLGGFKLELEFSDGTAGVQDFGSILQKSGPMAEPLKDPAYFARVFIEDGALTWPNGYDWDPIALHDEKKAADYCSNRMSPRAER